MWFEEKKIIYSYDFKTLKFVQTKLYNNLTQNITNIYWSEFDDEYFIILAKRTLTYINPIIYLINMTNNNKIRVDTNLYKISRVKYVKGGYLLCFHEKYKENLMGIYDLNINKTIFQTTKNYDHVVFEYPYLNINKTIFQTTKNYDHVVFEYPYLAIKIFSTKNNSYYYKIVVYNILSGVKKSITKTSYDKIYFSICHHILFVEWGCSKNKVFMYNLTFVYNRLPFKQIGLLELVNKNKLTELFVNDNYFLIRFKEYGSMVAYIAQIE